MQKSTGKVVGILLACLLSIIIPNTIIDTLNDTSIDNNLDNGIHLLENNDIETVLGSSKENLNVELKLNKKTGIINYEEKSIISDKTKNSIPVAFLIEGTYFIIATAILDAIRNGKYDHYEAILINGDLYLGNNISYNEAIERLKRKGDVWSKNSTLAWCVANAAGKINPTNVEKHENNDNYYWHYHARTSNKTRMRQHSFC
ncbi:Hypothetical protein CM240_3344 [Clostridium bornimense]|uniref:Uncharacterized protein n=1 Tax=Clostridium bornimense TaxID=1216932 RepID=W6S0M8_9CLOT|nr:hypothetical protein [Clostridium bornimense]CDM70461.1 Hypothetical protein CM240_3344 [Clostridium bornimense]